MPSTRVSSRKRGRMSCWISRVSRVSTLPSRLTTKISQSSFGIIWKVTRLPSRDSAGASIRSGPLRATVADVRSPAGAVASRYSVPSRVTYATVDPSDESASEVAVTVVVAPVSARRIPKGRGAPASPRPPPAVRTEYVATAPDALTSRNCLSPSPVVIARGAAPSATV